MTLTNADIQRYVRIGLHFLAGVLVSHGFAEQASWVTASSGIVVEGATLAWSIYGMRITAKLHEMSELGQNPASPVKGVVLSSSAEGKALATEIPGPVNVEGSIAAKEIAQQNH